MLTAIPPVPPVAVLPRVSKGIQSDIYKRRSLVVGTEARGRQISVIFLCRDGYPEKKQKDPEKGICGSLPTIVNVIEIVFKDMIEPGCIIVP